MGIQDDALKIVNTHSYKICKLCKKSYPKGECCKIICLPAEIFVQLVVQSDDEKLRMLQNVKTLFEDKEKKK